MNVVFFSILLDLWRISTRRERYEGILAVLFSMVAGLLDTVGVGLIFVYLSFLTKSHNYGSALLEQFMRWLGVFDPIHQAIYAGALTLAAYLVKNVYIVFCFWFVARVSAGLFEKIVRGIYTNLLGMAYLDFAKRKPPEIVKIINSDAYVAFGGVITPALFLISDILAFFFVCAALIVFKPVISLVALGVIGCLGALFFSVVRRLLNSYGRLRSESISHMVRWVTLTLRGYKEVRAYQKTPFFTERFGEHFSQVVKGDRVMRIVEQGPRLLNEILLVIALIAVLLGMIFLDVPLAEQIPMIAAFGMAGARLIIAANRIMGSGQTIQYYYADYKSLMAEFSAGKAEVAQAEKTALPLGSHQAFTYPVGIALDNVRFSYPGGPEIIKGVSLVIEANSSVAFVGPSGAGKSTLIDLLLGLLKPSAGAIRGNGVDIQTDIAQWQSQIGYMPQFFFLMDDTIRANVAFGIPRLEVDEARLLNALAAAQLKDFILGMPAGVDTVLGENGLSLSGGQQQRVSFARAIYLNPAVLLLDEATAALDNQTEKALISALLERPERKTTIYVAHRLTSIQHCDKIFVMERGNLVASGTYDELLKNSECFRAMVMGAEQADIRPDS